jgi:hypothetical protein
MGTLLKLFAVVAVIGGLWVWLSGRSVTEQHQAVLPPTRLSASVGLAPSPAADLPFDEEGTIVLDMTQTPGGTPYILYTEYSEAGKPSVRTKRLVFTYRDACADVNLPCATNQPGVPVAPDEAVRVVGRVKNEQVEVDAIYRL